MLLHMLQHALLRSFRAATRVLVRYKNKKKNRLTSIGIAPRPCSACNAPYSPTGPYTPIQAERLGFVQAARDSAKTMAATACRVNSLKRDWSPLSCLARPAGRRQAAGGRRAHCYTTAGP